MFNNFAPLCVTRFRYMKSVIVVVFIYKRTKTVIVVVVFVKRTMEALLSLLFYKLPCDLIYSNHLDAKKSLIILCLMKRY